ncbi:hypothetical protein [Paenibacillus elgii]|uniref:hypothetical protein n=1 Tax=Paenibacillus elgii TaxID=189691 RepID=UPI0024158FB3|nr:hypothetical protein [Paenibacillus elgii]
MKPYPCRHSVAKFDLTLNAAEEGDQIVCNLEYADRLFKKETIRPDGEAFHSAYRRHVGKSKG